MLCRWLTAAHPSLSFHGKEIRSSPKRRSDGRLSRTSSTEKESAGDAESKKESDENKENLRLDEYYSDTSGLLHDQDSWNESVISGEACSSSGAWDLIPYKCSISQCH